MNLEELKEKRSFLISEYKARVTTKLEQSPYNKELLKQIQEINEQIFSLLTKTV